MFNCLRFLHEFRGVQEPRQPGRSERDLSNKIVIEDSIFAANRLDTIADEVGHLLGLNHNDPGVNVDRTTPTVLGDIILDGTKLDKLTAAQVARGFG